MKQSILKRLFGIARISYPYVDNSVRKECLMSHMGGVISEGVIAIIGDNTSFNNLLKKKYEIEGYEVYIFPEKDFVSNNISDIMKTKKFSIFVNAVEYRSYNVSFETNDIVHSFYSRCQIQGDYFIENQMSGHIVNVLISWNDNQVVSSCIKGLTEGLGVALGNHRIIVNGILSDASVEEDNVANWTLFLSSKYGDLLCGSVLNLHLSMDRKERLLSF